jgi:phage N-6-adenine-methyltransferase
MSLVGFSARNHPQQAVRDTVDDRGTLPALFDPLNRRYSFTLDAAASDANALCAKYYTRVTDGLLRSWGGERVWCNPPYSRLEAWVAKAWAEMRGDCALVVMLLPANRCEQGWWQDYVEPFRDGPATDGIVLRSRFLRGRSRFRMPPGFQYYTTKAKGDRPPFGCVVLTWSRVLDLSGSLSERPA